MHDESIFLMNRSQDDKIIIFKITESFLFVAGYSEKQESQSMYMYIHEILVMVHISLFNC